MHGKDSFSRARRLLVGGLAGVPALYGMPRVGFGLANADPADASIVSADKVLNVADFESLARAKLPPAHFGYIATGADDDRTVSLNHEAYSHIEIRSRRFFDVSKLDTRCSVLGSVWKQPIYFSAVSSMRAFHPEGAPPCCPVEVAHGFPGTCTQTSVAGKTRLVNPGHQPANRRHRQRPRRAQP